MSLMGYRKERLLLHGTQTERRETGEAYDYSIVLKSTSTTSFY